jgi:ribosomal protein L24E
MSYLYRHALFVSRKQPYLDWANGLNDGGPGLSEDVSLQQRTVYLVPELDREPDLGTLLDEFWEDIFHEELATWSLKEESWPRLRTREIFDQWFDIELNASVYDLTPEEPLTQIQVDLADLSEASGRCAECGLDVEEGEGRFVGFKLADRSRFESFQGRVLPLPVNDNESVLAIVTLAESDEARSGDDLLVRVCSSRCEKVIRKLVPPALRSWTRRLESTSQS